MNDLPEMTSRKAQGIAFDIRQKHGIEMLPDEIHPTLLSAVHDVRRKMESRGHSVPESDLELLHDMQDAIRLEEENKAMVERVWKKVKRSIDAIEVEKKPYAVTFNGHPQKRFMTLEEAIEDCQDRNARSVRMRLNAVYELEKTNE